MVRKGIAWFRREISCVFDNQKENLAEMNKNVCLMMYYILLASYIMVRAFDFQAFLIFS